jgi:uncharacterized membrane protein
MPLLTGLCITFAFYYLYKFSRLEGDSGEKSSTQSRFNIVLILSLLISLGSCSVVPLQKKSVLYDTEESVTSPETEVLDSEYYGYGFVDDIGGNDASLRYIQGGNVRQNVYSLKIWKYSMNIAFSVLLIPFLLYLYFKREKQL